MNRRILLLTVIDKLMENNPKGIQNKNIYNALVSDYHDKIDKEALGVKAKILEVKSDDPRVIKKVYEGTLKKVWGEIKDEIEKGEKQLVEVGRKNKIYRYPDSLDFNPCERILDRERRNIRQTIYDILKDSSELLPPLWSFSLGLLPEDNGRKIIQFDTIITENQELLPEFYKYIKEEKVVEFDYQKFEGKKVRVRLSPHLLKEFNLRWYVFGYVHGMPLQESHYPLDRIDGKVSCVDDDYLKPQIDYVHYFDDIVGVTHEKSQEMTDVVLQVDDPSALGYIKTKELHHSQEIEGNIVKLRLRVNYEFKSRLLPFADRLVVVKPLWLKERLKEWADNISMKCK